MAHLRSARNVSNLQVGSLRYDRTDVPPYGGVLSVETTGKVTITDEIRLRNLNVIDSIAVGTTLQVNGALTAGSADIYGTLTASDDLFVDGSAVFTGNVDLCGNVFATGNIKGKNATFSEDVTAFRLRAQFADISGILFGDDIDVSGHLLVDGSSNLIGHVRMYEGLGVTGRATFHNGIVVNGPGATLASLRVTGAETVAGGLTVTGGGLSVTGGGVTLSNTLRVNGAGSFYNNMMVAGTFRSGGIASFMGGAFTNGNSTVSANLLVGGRIGIGTTTPTTRLEIYDPANPKIYLTGVGGVTGFFSHAGIGVDIGNEGSAVPIRLMPGNTERVRIDGSGNMGVGTTTPATVVQISNPTQTALTGLAVRSDTVNTTIGNYTGPYGAASNYGSIQTTDFGGATTIGTNPYPLILQPLGGRVCVGGAEYNVIANTEKFQVADNVLVRTGAGITVGTGYSTSYITLNNANAGATANQQTLTVSMDGTSGSASNAILNAAALGTATVPNLVFQTGGVERARVTNSGQVAFTVAGDVLSQNIHTRGVVGTTYLNGQGAYLSWNNDGGSGQTYLVDQRGEGVGGFRFQIFDTSNTFVKEPLTITNTAVTNGIAQATFTQTDIATGATTTNTAALTVQNASGGVHNVSLYTNMNGGSYNGLSQAGDKGLIFSNGTANTGNLVIGPWLNAAAGGLRITNTGNVGVGTASPAYTLDVSGIINPYTLMSSLLSLPLEIVVVSPAAYTGPNYIYTTDTLVNGVQSITAYPLVFGQSYTIGINPYTVVGFAYDVNYNAVATGWVYRYNTTNNIINVTLPDPGTFDYQSRYVYYRLTNIAMAPWDYT
jgi:hypothetical protein